MSLDVADGPEVPPLHYPRPSGHLLGPEDNLSRCKRTARVRWRIFSPSWCVFDIPYGDLEPAPGSGIVRNRVRSRVWLRPESSIVGSAIADRFVASRAMVRNSGPYEIRTRALSRIWLRPDRTAPIEIGFVRIGPIRPLGLVLEKTNPSPRASRRPKKTKPIRPRASWKRRANPTRRRARSSLRPPAKTNPTTSLPPIARDDLNPRTLPEKTNPFPPPRHPELRPTDRPTRSQTSVTNSWKDEANGKNPGISPTVGSREGWPGAVSMSTSPIQEDRSPAVRLTQSFRPATGFVLLAADQASVRHGEPGQKRVSRGHNRVKKWVKSTDFLTKRLENVSKSGGNRDREPLDLDGLAEEVGNRG